MRTRSPRRLQTALHEIGDAEPPPDLGNVGRLLRDGR